MRGPGVFLLDTEVHKQFRMPYKEGHMFQFRFEPLTFSITRTGDAWHEHSVGELRSSHCYVHRHAPDSTRTEVLVLIQTTLSRGPMAKRHPRPLARALRNTHRVTLSGDFRQANPARAFGLDIGVVNTGAEERPKEIEK